MSEYVTAEDLDVPDCECGHHPGKHQAVPHHYSARLIECECRKTADDLDLAHLDSIVRREVAKELRTRAEWVREISAGWASDIADGLDQRAAGVENGGQS